MASKAKHPLRRDELGYLYRGRRIYRRTDRRDAYNPWVVSFVRYGFPTRAEAIAWVDAWAERQATQNPAPSA